MLKASLKPLEVYKGSDIPWKCKCLKCKKTVTPMLASINSGQGGCIYCTPFGLNMTNPSYIYLITNERLGSHKVGIGNHKKLNDRLGRFLNQGWEAHKVWEMETGAEALRIEKSIFKVIRKDLKIPVHLSRSEMPKTEGHTETVSADTITLMELEKIIAREIEKHRK
jgi:hypothetical protein